MRLQMPELAQSRAQCDSERGARIRPCSDGQADAEIGHQRLMAQTCARGLDQPVLLRLAGRERYGGLRGAPRTKAMLAERDAPTAGRLPRSRTARPVGVAVNVDPICPLKRISIYNTFVAQQEASHTLKSSLGRLRRHTHEPAHFLRRELQVDSVLSEVVPPSRLQP